MTDGLAYFLCRSPRADPSQVVDIICPNLPSKCHLRDQVPSLPALLRKAR